MTINIPDEILTRMPYTKSQLMLIYYFLYKNNDDNFFNDLQKLIKLEEIYEKKDSNDNLIDYEMNSIRKINMTELLTNGILSMKNVKYADLVNKLKEIYPKGKKPGTNQYWTEGISLIDKRLQLFFKRYGNIYSNEDIVEATRKYVTNMENDPYMKTLKYFILKNKAVNGMIEEESELYNYLENKEDDNSEESVNWGSTMI